MIEGRNESRNESGNMKLEEFGLIEDIGFATEEVDIGDGDREEVGTDIVLFLENAKVEILSKPIGKKPVHFGLQKPGLKYIYEELKKYEGKPLTRLDINSMRNMVMINETKIYLYNGIIDIFVHQV